ncbi:MAG: hypothetical protein EPO13_02765 [Actinomycetota bacterium]|nr:MAG: hypothetical protein EPO13_02765 [Actinomycetota bacterium]
MDDPTDSVEILVMSTPGHQENADLHDGLVDLIESGDIRILDLVAVRRHPDGSATLIDRTAATERFGFAAVIAVTGQLMSHDQLAAVADRVPLGTTTAVMVFEHLWLRRALDAITATGATVRLHELCPASDVRSLLRRTRLPAS